MYRMYYIKNNYMFRHFTLAIFCLRNETKLVSSYTRLVWVVYSGEVRSEVGTGYISLPSCNCVRQIHTLQYSLTLLSDFEIRHLHVLLE